MGYELSSIYGVESRVQTNNLTIRKKIQKTNYTVAFINDSIIQCSLIFLASAGILFFIFNFVSYFIA